MGQVQLGWRLERGRLQVWQACSRLGSGGRASWRVRPFLLFAQDDRLFGTAQQLGLLVVQLLAGALVLLRHFKDHLALLVVKADVVFEI